MEDDLRPREAEHQTTKALHKPMSRGQEGEIAWEEVKTRKALYAEPYLVQEERREERRREGRRELNQGMKKEKEGQICQRGKFEIEQGISDVWRTYSGSNLVKYSEDHNNE